MPSIRAVVTLPVLVILLLSHEAAVAGPFAAAFAAGALSRAEAMRDSGHAMHDDADGLANCRLLLFENRLSDASACFGTRLKSRPDEKASLAGLARAEFRGGNFTDAATAFAKAGQPVIASEAASLAAVRAYHIMSNQPAYIVAFEREDPLPLLRVRLPDGKNHLFVLDTGGGETVLSPPAARASHVNDIAGTVTGTFAGGHTAPIRYGILPQLTLGSLTIEQIPVHELDTAPFAAALGASVDGVIGTDLLRHFAATINYPKQQLELRTAAPPAPAGAQSRPFWMAESHLLLAEATIDGVPELALVDTGLAGQGCTLPASTLNRIGQVPHGPAGTGVGGGGAADAVSFTAKSVSLANASAQDVPCLFGPFPPTLENATGARIGLLVSHSFLKTYAVTFDFDAMRLSLK